MGTLGLGMGMQSSLISLIRSAPIAIIGISPSYEPFICSVACENQEFTRTLHLDVQMCERREQPFPNRDHSCNVTDA